MTSIPSPSDAASPLAKTPPQTAGALRGSWNPYVVGAAIGVLSWLVFAVVDKPLGISTSLSAMAGWCAAPIIGTEGVARNPYWAKFGPKWDYGMVLIVGTFLGALASALTSRMFRVEVVPKVWRERFGPSKSKRLLFAFVGGILILYGARMAGGCTSGHGISGSLQLALSSWTFFITMFASGIVTAWLLFGRRGE
jgi:uncharacterized protein